MSEILIHRLQRTKETFTDNLNPLIDKAQQVSDDWKQTATQGTQNAINHFTDKFADTVGQTKGSFEENLQQVTVQNVITSSFTDWIEQHSAFLRIIKSFNWLVNHPIISLIIILFSLAILWSLIKAIGRLIESASLSILQIPLKLFQTLIKYCWFFIRQLINFTKTKFTGEKIVNPNSKFSLNNNHNYQVLSDNKQQRLTDISTRLEEIQKEQQELLQEATDILNSEKINSSVN